MMSWFPNTIQPAMIVGSPLQWVALAIVVVAIFAPKLLPLLGRLVGIEARRRVGLPPVRHISRGEAVLVEKEPVESSQQERSLEDEAPRASSGRSTVLLAAGLVALAIAVLSWFMLRS